MSSAVWDERQSLPREMKWIAIVPCAVFAGLVCLRLAIQYATSGALYLEDDAFYYTVIAHHIAQSGVSTFDGQTLTNGYHPLWLGVLVLQDLIVGGSIYVTIAIEVVLATAGVWFFLTSVRTQSLFLRTIFAVALAILTRPMIARGMEVSLLIFALGLFTRIAVAVREGRGSAVTLGLAAALCIGARIDSAVFVLPVLLLVVRDVRGAIRALAPLALCGVVFAAANLWFFGTPFPISGAIKSLGGFQINWRLLEQMRDDAGESRGFHAALAILGGMYGRSLVLAALCAIALLFVGRRDKSFPLLLAFVAGFTLFAVKLVFFSSWKLWPWYAFPAVIGFTALFHALDDMIARANLRLDPRFDVVATFLLVVSAGLQLRGGAASVAQNFELVNREAIAAFAPVLKGQRVAMGDRAGSFAAFYDGPLTQLEGLVNDKDYFDAIRTHRDIKALLCARGVRYVVAYQRDLGDYATATVPVMRPALTGYASPTLSFSHADEVGRFSDLAKYDNRIGGDEGDSYLYAWRLSCPVGK